jgi:hypothetical protein
MPELTGTVRNGVVVPDHPLPLPDGAKVHIHPDVAEEPLVVGMREEDWPTTPEGVAALLARWEQHEPLLFTPEEEESLAAWRAEMKRYNVEAVRKQMGLSE